MPSALDGKNGGAFANAASEVAGAGAERGAVVFTAAGAGTTGTTAAGVGAGGCCGGAGACAGAASGGAEPTLDCGGGRSSGSECAKLAAAAMRSFFCFRPPALGFGFGASSFTASSKSGNSSGNRTAPVESLPCTCAQKSADQGWLTSVLILCHNAQDHEELGHVWGWKAHPNKCRTDFLKALEMPTNPALDPPPPPLPALAWLISRSDWRTWKLYVSMSSSSALRAMRSSSCTV